MDGLNMITAGTAIGTGISATTAGTMTATDLQFRYDSGGHIYNLSLKNYAPGRYGMSVFAGSDRSFFYTVEFQVK